MLSTSCRLHTPSLQRRCQPGSSSFTAPLPPLPCYHHCPATTRAAGVVAQGLKENVQALPSIDGITQVVLQPLGHTIPNQEGKKASVAIYAHLAAKYGGSLSQSAAQEGLELYDEVVADAKARPGAHPNIDILLDVLQQPDLKISIQVDRQ